MRNSSGLGGVLVLIAAACSGTPTSLNGSSGGAGGGGIGTGGFADAGGTGNAAGQSGGGSDAVPTGGTGAGGSTVNLCAGLVQDKTAHPMTTLAKPALGASVTDPEFQTTIRRITAVASGGSNPAIVPMYSTISAWNADESLLILYSVAAGEHQLYNGKSYKFIRALDINPPDVEQVYWHTSDPDLLYYVDGQQFIRYHVSTGTKDSIHDFKSLCGSNAVSNGEDPMFTSWDSHRMGLVCGNQMLIYDISTDSVFGPKAVSGTPPAQVAPSGTLAFLEAGSGQVFDQNLNLARSLTLQDPANHASLGRLANGHDTWNGTVYDDGNDDAKSNVGNLVTWDLTDGSGGAVIGPKTGYPYPPDGHVSAMAYRQPGWVFVSTYGNTNGQGLLDLENLVADTNTGTVCRIGRHRSWGKSNTHIGTSYWAEAHTVPSPSGTRATFASDWGNGTTVDTYVVELPSYAP